MISNIARNLSQQIIKSQESINCSQARSISSTAQNARSPSSGKGSFEGKDCQEVYDVVIKQLKNTTARERYNESKHNFGRAATEKRDKEGLLLHMKTFLEGVCPQILPASTI